MRSNAAFVNHAGKSLANFLADNELLHVKLEGEPRGLLWATFARQCGLPLDPDRGLAFDTAISAVQFARSGAGVALAELRLDGEVDRVARLCARFIAPVIPGGAVRVVVQGDGAALAWRLEDAASGRVCVTGEAEIR